MMIALDTNIILDVILGDAVFADSSKALLDQAVNTGGLIICEVVYAELSTQFPSHTDLQSFLRDTRIRLLPSGEESLWLASRAWSRYANQRGSQFQCTQCGEKSTVQCTCGTQIRSRQHIISDFLIGGHAQMQANTLLTRDRGFYKTYFPDLRLNLL